MPKTTSRCSIGQLLQLTSSMDPSIEEREGIYTHRTHIYESLRDRSEEEQATESEKGRL